jgi:hypothetical protein
VFLSIGAAASALYVGFQGIGLAHLVNGLAAANAAVILLLAALAFGRSSRPSFRTSFWLHWSFAL